MKTTRGISKEFAEAFRQSELYRLYNAHKDELVIGVRTDYLNLYYNCDSIAKVAYRKQDGRISCEIDKYYLDGKHYDAAQKEKRYKAGQSEICAQYELIKKHSDAKATAEKKAQAKLVILNNSNKDSNWFCIDVEYVKQFTNEQEKIEADFNGRFDIIALSKAKPHRVALIELKYGSGSIGGTSGIYKHVEDFTKFCNKNYFHDHLKNEMIDIIQSQIDLGLSLPVELPSEKDIASPDFYFITLNNNAESERATTPKQTMAGYLFKDYRWDCKRLSKLKCVEKEFGDITKKNNPFHATFLFSKATIDTIAITDIIDGAYDERIVPE